MLQGSPSFRARRGDGALLPDPGMRWGLAPQPRGLTPSSCQVPGGVPNSTLRRIPSWRSKRRSSRSRLSTPEAMAARWQSQVPNPVPVIAPFCLPPKLHGPRDTPNRGAGMGLVRGSREHGWAWAHVCGTMGRCIYTHMHICDSACDHVDVCTAGCAHGHTGTRVCRAVCLCNHTTTQYARVCPHRHGCVNTCARMCQHLYVSTSGKVLCACVWEGEHEHAGAQGQPPPPPSSS